MKKKIITSCLLVLSISLNAQWPNVGAGPSIYKSPLAGSVGIGLLNPIYKLDITTSNTSVDDGININNGSSNTQPSIYLRNTFGATSKNFSLRSEHGGSGTGSFIIKNETDGIELLRFFSNGKACFGASAAPAKLQVYTSTELFGIRSEAVNQTFPIGIAGYVSANGTVGSFARGIFGDARGGETNNGGYFTSIGGNDSKGVYASAIGANQLNYGGYFEATNTTPNGYSIGSYGIANSNNSCIGVLGTNTGGGIGIHYGGVFSSNEATNNQNIGSFNSASNGTDFNIGVVGLAAGPSNAPIAPFTFHSIYPQTNIGVYGTSSLPTGYTTPSNNWAGWFDNDVMINGTGYNTSFGIFTSDRKFKREIKTIENASDIIGRLNPSTYFMKTDNEFGLNFNSNKQFGFISQEVEEVLPDLVVNVHKPEYKDHNGELITKEVDYKGLNYMGFIALLTKGMQEQQQQIVELKTLVNTLVGHTDTDTKTSNIKNTSVELSDKNAVVLNQNVPNPFAESTVISYTIPNDFTKAQILFTTNEGKIIRVIDITEKGSGNLNVFANDLTNGIYTYTLVIDGKTIDSKKMIKE